MFILVLTVLSLVVMVALLLPLSNATITLLRVYDNFICFIFLGDFAMRMRRASSKSEYFLRQRGWLDLLGSIPSLGFFKYSGILRLARLSRLARIMRLMKGRKRKEMVEDVLQNRSKYAVFITVLTTFVVLGISSVMVLQFESQSPEANIVSGGQALWYSVVTITTVGYGDFYPVTTGGRISGFFIMVAGIGVIGALASILASILVAPGPGEEADQPVTLGVNNAGYVAVQAELAELRAVLDRIELQTATTTDRGSGGPAG